MNATDRFKWLYVGAVERVCVLEADLEAAQARIAELEAAEAAPRDDGAREA